MCRNKPLSTRITDFFFWVLMGGLAIFVALMLSAQVCKAGVLAECSTDEECEQALNESVRIIDQSTIPEALKWYCNEYPDRFLGNGPTARTLTGHPIEIESCEQVILPEDIYDVV